jgi:hypothetical protein
VRALLVGCAALAALAAAAVTASSAQAQAARDFWGMISIVDPTVEEFERMGQGNVGTLRLLVQWPDVEPSPDQYDWEALDYYFANAAANGIEVFPFPYGTPAWAGVNCAGLDPETCERVPPIRGAARAAWVDFLQDLVGRYGSQGTFWSNPNDSYNPPYVPVREVQIWNEPSSQTYWRPTPKPKQYGTLVKVSHNAIAAVDPSVQVVLAGVFPAPELGEQFKFTRYLEQLYAVKGIKRFFDSAAFHPYARTIKRLRNQIKTVRRLMREAGLHNKPLWISELGWGSAQPYENRPLIKGIEGQRAMLEEGFALLERMRAPWRLAGVIWYSWRDPGFELDLCPFCSSSGLFDVNGAPKPSWFSYVQRTGGLAE